MFTFYLYFLMVLINNLDASSRRSKNQSDDYSNDFVPRVVNGWPAKLGDVPYQIAFKIRIRRKYRLYSTFCGGVITAPMKLLSAAHCFARTDGNLCRKMCGGSPSEKSLSPMAAVAGNLRNRGYFSDVDSPEEGQWRLLSRVVYPHSYRFPRHDIAIVWTRQPFIFNDYISAIPIATKNVDYRGKCLVSGYGRINRQQQSNQLLLAHLVLIPSRRCSYEHRRNMIHFVCTSSAVTDVGKGDSGGPLVCTGTGDPNEVGEKGILVGIVSGHRYGVSSFFTRVSSYYNYIQRGKSSTTELDIRLLYLLIIHIMNLLLF